MISFFPQFGTFYYLAEWVIRIVMLLVVPMRRTPEATRSWLLLIFFLPIPGLLLYLAIGRPRFPAWRKRRFTRAKAALTAYQAHDGQFVHSEITDLAERLGDFPAVSGNAVELLSDYDGVIDRLVQDIDQARHHVRILVYIFADDATGGKVADALARAVQRGVSAHLLVDPVGSHRWIARTLARLRAEGVHVRQTLPFHWLRGRTRRDMRNHRKLFIIDGMIGYAGSQNIIDKDFRPGVENRELVARIEGPVVAQMSATFLTDWFLETEVMLEDSFPLPTRAGEREAQLLPSGADYPLEGFQTLLIWQLHRACRRVVITSPYFIPDEALLGAMRTAVARGVKVDLIVSAVVDQPLVSLAQRSYYEDLLEAGVGIHLYRHFLLHAKNVSIDGVLGIIGSSNVDLRSFQLNEEVSLLLHDAVSIEELEKVQTDYMVQSDRLTADLWRARPRIGKLKENMARMVSPLL